MWDEDDFYYEPSEFEQKMTDLKESLLKSVKADFLSDIDELKKENAELMEVKKNFEQIKDEYRQKERQLEFERNDLLRKLEFERNDLLRTVRKDRLSTLMKDFEIITYRAQSKHVLPPKCEKCDSYRRVGYKTPMGRDSSEECACSVGKSVYSPVENIVSSFHVDRGGTKMDVWYKFEIGSSNEEYLELSSSTYGKKMYSEEMQYGDIERYSTFFRNKEECQKFCDWLNAKERI